MTTVHPPTPTPPPVPTLGTAVTLTVQNPPPALTQLPAGALIDAQVVANLDKGLTELNSALGKLEIKTTVPLPENAKLDLQVIRATPQTQLLIKALNDQPIQQTTIPEKLGDALKAAIQATLKTIPNSALPASPEVQTSSNNPVSTPIKLDIGALLKATLLRPIGSQPTTHPSIGVPTNPSNAQPGTPPGNSNVLPGPAKTSAQNIQQSSIPSNPTASMDKGSIQTTAAILSNQAGNNGKADTTSEIKAGTNVTLRFIGVGLSSGAKTPPSISQIVSQTAARTNQSTTTTPQQTLTASNNPQAAVASQSVINGIVVATTPGGQPIIDTPVGMLALENKVPISPGQTLRLEVISSQPTTSLSTPEARFEANFLSREWPSLTDAIRQIGLAAPSVSQKLVNQTLPQPNTQLTSNLIFFLNALKGGSIQNWMGPAAMAQLEQATPDLLGRLDEDFTHLGRAFSEPQSNDWRTALVPFFNGMGLEQFQMHTRGQMQEGEDGRKEDGSRFVIDIILSNLGRFQLDGFVRTKGKRLDLIVRTETTLPTLMRRDINKIFIDFSEAAGVAGQIAFQADKKFVEIAMPQLSNHGNKDVII